MKSSHTRQPLHTQHTGDKSEKPFFSGNREKNKQSENAFFQAKKIDGNQDSALENEADAVAQKVTTAQQAPVKSSQRMGQMAVQKKGADDEKDAKAQRKEKKEKDESVQRKEEDRKEMPKNAEEEKDAKSVQKKEQKDEKGDAKVQKKSEEDKKDKTGEQKKGADEEKKDAKPQKKEKADEKDDRAAVQKKENKADSPGEKTEGKHESNEDKFDRLLNKSKDGGSPLPAKVRTQLEQQMNANFEMVRIHTGQEAIEMCNLSKAQAFTHGNDIYFNAAKFDPESTAGMTLLAHELTHIVQQNGPRK